ncbi:MAG: DUF4097 family beta strand repeat protein [Synergistetes bacterium]|nr:DUF4097 family beta strand repeat protein [Synergistota bacterium]
MGIFSRLFGRIFSRLFGRKKETTKGAVPKVEERQPISINTVSDSDKNRLENTSTHVRKGGDVMKSEVIERVELTEYSEPYENLLLVPPNSNLSLSNIAGDIIINSWDQSLLKIIAIKHSWGESKRVAREKVKKIEIKVNQQEDSVKILTIFPEIEEGVKVQGYVSYRLFVPKEISLNIQTESGNTFVRDIYRNVAVKATTGSILVRNIAGSVDTTSTVGNIEISNVRENVNVVATSGRVIVNNISGNIDIETSSGEVRVSNIEQNVMVTTEQGNIIINNIQGNVDAKSSTGDVSIDTIASNVNVIVEYGNILLDNIQGSITTRFNRGSLNIVNKHAPMIHASTTSGDINLNTVVHNGGKYLLETTIGTINMRIPSNSSTAIIAKTIKGNISCELPLIITRSGNEELAGILNQNKAIIKLTSTEGDINIKKK